MIPSFWLENTSPTPLGGLELIICVSVISYIVYIAGFAIYNIYFHPLHNFPGPKTWIVFPLLRHIAAIRGQLDEQMRNFHEVYGEVIRFSPKELSFITAQARDDIYKHLPKSIRRREFAANIITANDADHARFRRALSPAFSEKALRQQEPLMNIYIDLLIEKLGDVAASGESADMVKWYNLTTFDLIGDLAFGKSFDGLKDGKYHSWVALIFNVIKVFPFMRLANEYPLIKGVMRLMPKRITAARDEHLAHTKSVVMKRINNAALHGRGDFMDSMLRHKGQKDGLADDELVSNAHVLIIAGSETTATLLSGVTYWLLRTPGALSRVTEEVRTAFTSEAEINFVNATARLPFMLACLEEAFRMYPPVPSGLERYCPPGAPTDISGYRIPEGVSTPSFSFAVFPSGSPG
jgi:cytochrome P450